MLDLAIYPDLDALAADLAHATGKRVVVDVDALPDGFAMVTPISDQHPLTKIVVNQRFGDMKYAIAGLHLAQELRRAQHHEIRQKASANPRTLTILAQQVSEAFGRPFRRTACRGSPRFFTTESPVR